MHFNSTVDTAMSLFKIPSLRAIAKQSSSDVQFKIDLDCFTSFAKTALFVLYVKIAKVVFKLISFSILMLLCFNSAFSVETSSQIYISNPNHQPDFTNYWSSEKIMGAKPLKFSRLNESMVEPASFSQESTKRISMSGAPPKTSITSLTEQLIPVKTLIKPKLQCTEAKEKMASISSDILTETDTLNIYFTSSRLVPESAHKYYPYLTIGKLYFTIPNKGNFTCSASVLSNRIIITAGHCVHDGLNGKNGFYKNFMFVPAYRKGEAPVGRWFGNYAAVHAQWANGDGILPNDSDYGMIELKDRRINGIEKSISEFTGYLGYRTNSLQHNHAHLLGYACNLDAGQQMHQVISEAGRTVAAKNVEYGSDMRGGSDGSPWIQNFGLQGKKEEPGSTSGINQILGVVSYYYEDSNKMVEGGSGLDNRFLTLLNKMCKHKPGNCKEDQPL